MYHYNDCECDCQSGNRTNPIVGAYVVDSGASEPLIVLDQVGPNTFLVAGREDEPRRVRTAESFEGSAFFWRRADAKKYLDDRAIAIAVRDFPGGPR
jgi:hypothetical protein